MLSENIGKRIKDFGREAGVVVNTQTGRTASAHDIRASFLTHLAEVTDEDNWTEVARHSDSKVTKNYYLWKDAAKLAKKLGW